MEYNQLTVYHVGIVLSYVFGSTRKFKNNEEYKIRFGDEKKKCYCCEYPKINDDNFHAGHAKSHKDDGKVSCDNLRPICYDCNSSMKDKHMLRYMYENNLNWRKLYNELYQLNQSSVLE